MSFTDRCAGRWIPHKEIVSQALPARDLKRRLRIIMNNTDKRRTVATGTKQ